ncbi:MAG: hypothetical protein HY790_01685 [Deltaproteobacteria bacterium]|nr:hypothetical protein [Deltaproteobacteria bacterium]MBI4794549.1 hypothetical protein [Deltaproteobacteria bacterium]
MSKIKICVIVFAVLAILGAAVLTYAEPAKVGQVIYITRSKACGCSAEKVKVADKVVSQVFTGPRQALVKRIDYDTDRQAAVPYIGEFRLIQLPALLLLDSQGHLLWSAIGNLEPKQVVQKLNQLGG